MSHANAPCLLCGGLLGGHRESCGLNALKERHYEREAGMQTMKMVTAPKRKPKSRAPRGRVYALFVAGASIAELSRAFIVSEAEIEAALRGHIARRERERK